MRNFDMMLQTGTGRVFRPVTNDPPKELFELRPEEMGHLGSGENCPSRKEEQVSMSRGRRVVLYRTETWPDASNMSREKEGG